MNRANCVTLLAGFVCAVAANAGAQMIQLQAQGTNTEGTQLISLAGEQIASGNPGGIVNIMPISPPDDRSGSPISGGAPITVVPEPATAYFVLSGMLGAAFYCWFRRLRRT